MERKKVLVAFGDILGFGAWMRRAITTPEEAKELMEAVYSEFERAWGEMGCYVKFIGDGCMFIQEVSEKKETNLVPAATKFLNDLHVLSENVTKIILKHFPRPEGFRLRAAMGYVWKRDTGSPEYIGYVVNLTQRLLEISPKILCVCHESVAEIFARKKSHIKFEKLQLITEKPRGIDLEDLDNLWIFSIAEGK